MQVTCVGIKPTKALQDARAPVLTPELLAACGARYSRNGEGLAAILSKVDPGNEDAAVDSIFRMVDYGHQSIADMVPVAMFIDRISMWLALRIWWASPTAGGQESSTRYIELHPSATVGDHEFVCSQAQKTDLQENLAACFEAYQKSLEIWNQIVERQPSLLRLPDSLIQSQDPKDKRKVLRICRNFAFDRARYYLPMSAMTNVMLMMSARGWVSLIKQLASEQLNECRELAAALREQLNHVAPRLIRHARKDESFSSGARQEFAHSVSIAQRTAPSDLDGPASSGPFLDVMMPQGSSELGLMEALKFHNGRYDFIGSQLQRTAVRFGWQALPMAEIRDLNRHRTGSKYFSLAPIGTYLADDEIERIAAQHHDAIELCAQLKHLRTAAIHAAQAGRAELAAGNPAFVYWLPMGAQCFYEHTTTANHFLYQAELRTGLGSHYQYAARMAEVLALWHQRFPATAAYVKAGTAEPE